MNARLPLIGSLAALVLLLGSGFASAAPPQPISLDLSGVITNAGTQTYAIGGSTLETATIFGNQVQAGASFYYHLSARISGLNVTGLATFLITGMTTSGSSIVSAGTAYINQLDGSPFPIGCAPNTPVPCTSTIPITFNGDAGIVTTVAGVQNVSNNIPMVFESAYLNPFGNPIFFSSLDLSVLAIFTYNTATINWQNVNLGGLMTGTYKNSPASGQFFENVNSNENLVAGTESDSGTTTFLSMTPSVLDATGTFSGNTVIPTAGSIDCSALLGFPPGTCTLTGALSSGQFNLRNSTTSTSISGTYNTVWSVPSVTFNSTVSGTVSGKQS